LPCMTCRPAMARHPRLRLDNYSKRTLALCNPVSWPAAPFPARSLFLTPALATGARVDEAYQIHESSPVRWPLPVPVPFPLAVVIPFTTFFPLCLFQRCLPPSMLVDTDGHWYEHTPLCKLELAAPPRLMRSNQYRRSFCLFRPRPDERVGHLTLPGSGCALSSDLVLPILTMMQPSCPLPRA
jgi:hypothetical protein